MEEWNDGRMGKLTPLFPTFLSSVFSQPSIIPIFHCPVLSFYPIFHYSKIPFSFIA